MPEDIDAQYQLGATVGLLALYRGTVEGRAFAAFLEGRRAVSILKRVREQDATHRESALIPGIYRYAVSTLPWHKRLIATVAGMSGDKEGGIQLLETAAARISGERRPTPPSCSWSSTTARDATRRRCGICIDSRHAILAIDWCT